MKAVTFDFWNTLINADTPGIRDRRLTAWLGLLAGEGLAFEGDTVQAAMIGASRAFDDHWRRGQYFGADQAVAHVLEVLGIEVPSEVRAGMVAAITDPDPAHDPAPTPNVEVALDALRSAGIRIGIICDVGLAPSPTLRRILDGHGLLGYFDHWSFSDEVGTFKPDPVIFRHALDGLGGIDPADAAHVGDLRRTDIAGAQAMGMTAVRYAGIFDDPGSAEEGTDAVDGDAVITDHAQLLDALGIT